MRLSIFVLLLIVSGCLSGSDTGVVDDRGRATPSDAGGGGNAVVDVVEDGADNAVDAVDCEAMKTPDDQNLCLARKNDDQSYCEKITMRIVKATCYRTIAAKNRNWETCMNIDLDATGTSGSRDFCLLQVVTLVKDELLCEKINTPTFKERCVNEIKNGPDYCDKIEDESQRDQCNLMLGMKNYDENICKKIKYDRNRYTCISLAAAEKRDKNVCKEIEDEKARTNCEKLVDIKNKNVPK